MKCLKVGVIGMGFIGKQHIEAIRRIPGTELAAVSDCNAVMEEQMIKELGAGRFCTDYREILENPDIDVIHNCTPSHMHAIINEEAIAAGKHIYCEKPLTLRAEEAKRLVHLARAAGVLTGVNFNYRHNVMVHEMRERIREGRIGRTFMVYGSYFQDWLLYETDYDWRMDPARGGESRAIADIGSHCFDTAQYVLGKKITAVYAKTFCLYPVRKKKTAAADTFQKSDEGEEDWEMVAVSSEDGAAIMAEFEDGSHGSFLVNQVCAGAKNDLSVTVCGTEGSFTWRQERADHLAAGHRNGGNEDIYAGPASLTDYARRYTTLPAGHSVGWADALCNGITSFYHSIDCPEAERVYADFEDGWYLMRLMEACIKSEREGRWIYLM